MKKKSNLEYSLMHLMQVLYTQAIMDIHVKGQHSFVYLKLSKRCTKEVVSFSSFFYNELPRTLNTSGG
jgi:hypothetical protein